ncbi:MAG: thioredoxin family protein [Myxococcales bacterium]|nr:thioredoxin family protein [Myxococcales bacterium]
MRAPFRPAEADRSPRPRAAALPRRARRQGLVGAALVAAAILSSACGPATGATPDERAAKADDAPAPEAAPAPAPKATAPANGFGSEIAWRGFEEGLREAADGGKAMMLVVHASWCPKCKDLKKSFFDPGLVDASRGLVMVNVDQDEEPRSMIYSPDGTYVPRVLFVGPDGEVVQELKNGQRSRFHYFYTPGDDLVGMMKQAVARYGQS